MYNMELLLSNVQHRPWPLPKAPWRFYQEWNKAVFLHWQVTRDALRPLVPLEFELDEMDDNCWVSIVAFSMAEVRPRYFPAWAPVSDFHELNIRTYVKRNGKSGVYFLSIEAEKPLATFLCRAISGMPYRRSTMTRSKGVFQSENKSGSRFMVVFKPGEKIVQKSALDLWLTERYCVLQEMGGGPAIYEIHHAEWPVRDLEVELLDIDYPGLNPFFEKAPNKMHYSPGVDVLAWPRSRM